MLRILIADDHRLLAETLAESLSADPDFEVIGLANHPAQLQPALTRLAPDLLLLDLYFGDEVRDLSLARHLRAAFPSLNIVLLTGEIHKTAFIREAYQIGLAGYLSKSTPTGDLKTELKKAARGERVFSPDVLKALLPDQAPPKLTPMESAILDRIHLGMKRAAICEDLGIRAPSTYDTHTQHLKEKFGAKSTNELLRKATEMGCI